MSFQRQLEIGRVGESLIATYFQSRGYFVQPVYEIEKSRGKGPQLFGATRNLVLPDMMVFDGEGRIVYAEAKHKTVFTWHRKTEKWTTGIDKRHWDEYCDVEAMTGVKVQLYFFHRDEMPSESDRAHGCPPRCPTGLYGASLEHLRQNISHEALSYDTKRAGMVGHGNSGMVYWAEQNLKRHATKDEVLNAAKQVIARPA